MIDVGMVIQLNEKDRTNFVNFIKSIIEGNSETCTNMIFKLSNFEGNKIVEGKFIDYKDQLKKLFSVLDNTSIFEIEGINLLICMLDIIRNHNMKLDGEFATLITNMVVLLKPLDHSWGSLPESDTSCVLNYGLSGDLCS